MLVLSRYTRWPNDGDGNIMRPRVRHDVGGTALTLGGLPIPYRNQMIGVVDYVLPCREKRGFRGRTEVERYRGARSVKQRVINMFFRAIESVSIVATRKYRDQAMSSVKYLLGEELVRAHGQRREPKKRWVLAYQK